MILANFTGYWVGMGIEWALIVAAGVFLALMLTGVLFGPKKEKAPKAQKVLLIAESSESAAQAEEPAAEAVEEAESEATVAEDEAALADDEEAVAEPEPEPEVVEEVVEEKPKKAKKEEKVAEPEPEPAPAPEPEIVYIETDNGGVVFNESKSITELYEELSVEQKSFFDELREEALTKPDTELSITKSYISVKIGKKNLIKLLIRRGVTVAEFMLENEALKAFKSNTKNKKGKASIKVKPTVVQVLDLPSLKVAIDMIHLAYEEMTSEE